MIKRQCLTDGQVTILSHETQITHKKAIKVVKIAGIPGESQKDKRKA